MEQATDENNESSNSQIVELVFPPDISGSKIGTSILARTPPENKLSIDMNVIKDLRHMNE